MRYLIILATVLDLLRLHKMLTKYIFVFTKEWYGKTPKIWGLGKGG